MHRFLTSFLLAILAFAPDTSWAEEARRSGLKSVTIQDIPHVRQKPDFCGEACAEMALRKLGHKMDQDFVFDRSGLDPIHGRGCYTRELKTALDRIGFRTGATWYAVSASKAEQQMDWMFQQLHADLLNGAPSIVCTRYDSRPGTTEHFRLIVGYDAEKDEVLYHEPAANRGAYRRMKRTTLLELWPLKYEPQEWTVIWLRMQPVSIEKGVASTDLTDADFAQHLMQLKSRLEKLKQRQIALKEERDREIQEEREYVRKENARRAEEREKREAERKKRAKERREREAAGADDDGDRRDPLPENDDDLKPLEPKLKPRIVSDFQIVIQKPFVVVGDERLDAVRGHAEGVIAWAVRRLRESYFSKDPDHVIDIWLFGDKVSYQQNVVDIFQRRPHTPFGYYSPSEKALVMDISTGGGTLVHEIVHPFIAANFPECPSWFNEGLASLYEQCRDHNGRIWGLTNWRLRGLQKAIERDPDEIPTFQELCGASRREFYNYDRGTNYAQARYLCYYLQEKGLLRTYYREFRRSAKDDPTGYKTLKRVLKIKDEAPEEGAEAEPEKSMLEFQKDWNKFVLELRF